jgi:hypothetical protein
MQLGTGWQQYSCDAIASGTDSAARLTFAIRDNATVWLDDVKVQVGARGGYARRDYSAGIALVNPTDKSAGIPLGAVYRKLSGTQDSIINDGSYVSTVEVPSKDGIILLKTPPLTVPANKTKNYGISTKIYGTLRSVEGTALAERTVTLYSRIPGSTWVEGSSRVTTVSGSYSSFKVEPSSKRYYQVRFDGDMDNLRGYSRIMSVNVRPLVSTPKAPRTMRRSRYYTVYGDLRPKHKSGIYPVRIYRYKKTSSGKWKSYGYVKAKARNYKSYTKYYRKLRLTSRGRWRLRAYAPADSEHAKTWSSKYDYVTVR